MRILLALPLLGVMRKERKEADAEAERQRCEMDRLIDESKRLRRPERSSAESDKVGVAGGKGK